MGCEQADVEITTHRSPRASQAEEERMRESTRRQREYIGGIVAERDALRSDNARLRSELEAALAAVKDADKISGSWSRNDAYQEWKEKHAPIIALATAVIEEWNKQNAAAVLPETTGMVSAASKPADPTDGTQMVAAPPAEDALELPEEPSVTLDYLRAYEGSSVMIEIGTRDRRQILDYTDALRRVAKGLKKRVAITQDQLDKFQNALAQLTVDKRRLEEVATERRDKLLWAEQRCAALIAAGKQLLYQLGTEGDVQSAAADLQDAIIDAARAADR